MRSRGIAVGAAFCLLYGCAQTDTLPLASSSPSSGTAGASAGGSSATGGSSPSGGSSASAGHASGAAGASGASGHGSGHGGTSGSSGSPGSAGGPTGPRWCDLPATDDPGVVVPDGFCVRSYTSDATHVAEPRVIRFAPNGDVFVSAPGAPTPGGSVGGRGAIFVLPDDDHDGRADSATVYAGGTKTAPSCEGPVNDSSPDDFSCVHGIAFADGYLYFTKHDELRRIPYASGDRTAQSPTGELVTTLGTPDGGGDFRWTHSVDRAPDGRLYVARGRYGAECTDASMTEGAVLAIDPKGALPATPAVLTDGFRDPLYLRCNDSTGRCFTNELSGDNWDGLGGREKLALLEPSLHYGYPCCASTDVPVAPAADCSGIAAEIAGLELHSTPFGLDFERGLWPAPYTNAAFVAFHGYVGSWLKTRVAFVPFDPATGLPSAAGLPVGPDGQPIPTDFATGYGHLPDGNGGRATDVAFAPDGRLFVIDDASGIIVWIAPVDLLRP